MSKEEVQSYRLNSLEEPTDEMLEYIMLLVQKAAVTSTQKAQEELDRRFAEMCQRIAKRKQERHE